MSKFKLTSNNVAKPLSVKEIAKKYGVSKKHVKAVIKALR